MTRIPKRMSSEKMQAAIECYYLQLSARSLDISLLYTLF